jgi:hypothetical protein
MGLIGFLILGFVLYKSRGEWMKIVGWGFLAAIGWVLANLLLAILCAVLGLGLLVVCMS